MSEGGEKLFKQVPMKIVVPIIVITWILSIISALAIATSGVMSIGATGATGAKGDTGPAGAAGSQGPKGDAGAAGAAGTTGPAGSGSAGPAGPAGTAGTNGVNGVNGATWWNGTAAPPAPSLGSNGDFYLNTANGNVYNKVAGSWTNVGNIKGATGATGAQGPPGIGVVMYNNTNAGNSFSLTTTPKSFANITMTAPANGYVLLTATGVGLTNGDSTTIGFGLGNTTGTVSLYYVAAGASTGTTTIDNWWPVTAQAVVPVTAGTTYSFYTTAYQIMSAKTASIWSIYMTGVFYPA